MERDTPEPRWLDPMEQHAWRQYLHASRLLEAALDRDMVAQGLKLTEYEIIMALSEAPYRRLRMSAIAAEVVQSPSRVTHTAGRLESRGWVRREPTAGDRRGVELVLTEAGYAEVVRRAPSHARTVLENLVDPVPREDFLALGRTMGIVGRAIKNAEIQSIEKCQDVRVTESSSLREAPG